MITNQLNGAERLKAQNISQIAWKYVREYIGYDIHHKYDIYDIHPSFHAMSSKSATKLRPFLNIALAVSFRNAVLKRLHSSCWCLWKHVNR